MKIGLGLRLVMGPGKMRNCGMQKVKCGMDGAEICCGMVCKVRNEEC